jgi:hypothetical protein
MKNKSLKSIILLTALIAMQTGCNLSNHKTDLKTEYEQAKQLEKQGRFMVHEGEIDSALNYYDSSHALYQDIISRMDSAKDTLYIRGLVVLDQYIGLAYDTIHNIGKCQSYFFESLKWANIGHFAYERLNDEEIIGLKYIDSVGENNPKSTASREVLLKSEKYMQSACWDIDKLGLDKTPRALSDYNIMGAVYKVLGDSNKQKFYYEKYSALYDELHGIERPKINN